MSRDFASKRLRLSQAMLAQESTDPNAAGGTAASVGSFWQRASTYPAPSEMFLKVNASNTGWVKQNLVNLKIYNVRFYGAVGDGVTDDLAAIRAAVADAALTGGAVYFPATANFYNIVKVAGPGQTNLIDIAGIANLTLFGDGYASKVRQTGTAGGFETRMFCVRNGSSGIKFLNFYMDAATITNPDPGEQNHGIQILGSSVPGAGPSNVEVAGMYFGRFPGDGVRMLAETGKAITDVRIAYCAFDMKNNNAAGSRSAVGVQRFSHRVQVHYNWITGSHDQQIDFEPTGLPDPDIGGPSEYSIIGNQIDHEASTSDAVTLTGAGQNAAAVARQNVYAYNFLNRGGAVSGRNMLNATLLGNISVFTSTQNNSVMEFFENSTNCKFISNIAKSMNTTGNRGAFRASYQNGDGPKRFLVADNIFYAQGDAVSSLSAVDLEDLTRSVIAGNIIRVDTGIANVSVGVNNRSVNVNVRNMLMVGNTVISGGAQPLLCGLRFAQLGMTTHRNQAFVHNLVTGGSVNGLRWESVNGDFRGAVQNLGSGVTSQFLSTLQAIGEGGVNLSPGMIVCTFAAGPDTNITANVGCLAVNNSGGSNNTLFYKESGVTSSGWQRYGGADVAMGALALTTATAARFLAPGGLGLATETTVEIQWTAPRPGTIRNLSVRCTAGTGGTTVTYTVRKNAANTTLVTTINNTATTGSDTTHSFTVAAGDRISLQVTKATAPTTGQSNVCATMEFV